jgi:hypothetical protein
MRAQVLQIKHIGITASSFLHDLFFARQVKFSESNTIFVFPFQSNFKNLAYRRTYI